VFSVVNRLCEIVPGISQQSLAESLGLDRLKFREQKVSAKVISKGTKEVNRFRDCQHIKLKLNGQEFDFKGVASVLEGKSDAAGLFVPEGYSRPSSLKADQIANQAVLQARRYVCDYYDSEYRTEGREDEPSGVVAYLEDGQEKWKKNYSEADLHLQLTHMIHQIDVDQVLARIKDEEGSAGRDVEFLRCCLQPALGALKELRGMCAYSTINLKNILP